MENVNLENAFMLEEAIEKEKNLGHKVDLNMEPKKLKRVISNRLSAQKFRIRKIEYIHYMEKQTKDLQVMVLMLSPQIEQEQQHQAMLRMENEYYQQKLDFLTEISKRRNAEIKTNQGEVKRLKEISGRAKNDQEQNVGAGPAGSNWDSELEQIICMSQHQSSPPKMLELSFNFDNPRRLNSSID